MTSGRCLIAALGLALVCTGLRATENLPSTASPSNTKEILERIRKDAREDFAATARALAALSPERMPPEERATWVHLSRESAVRNGDRRTLEALRAQADPFALRPLARILLANAYLNEADFGAARAELAHLGDLSRINTRDRRRYWALQARLGQLEERPAEESAALEEIVHELAHWPSRDCQSCHDNPKAPQAVPLLEVQNSWFGKRFVELLRQSGRAEQLRRQSEAALARRGDDTDARIFLGFALLALGKQAEAEQCWAAIPWIALPGRSGVGSRALFAWP